MCVLKVSFPVLIMSFFKSFPVKTAITATALGIIVYRLVVSKFRKNKTSRYIVIESVKDWFSHEDEILENLKKSKVIGLDCEWVTMENKKKPLSLLQLANDSGFCVLIRLCFIPMWLLPSSLADLLADESILKVGVGIHDDANKLYNDCCLEVQGYMDLRYLAKDLKEIQGKTMSLKNLGLELLGLSLDKSRSLRCSDWNAPILSTEQVNYAAEDAVIAAQIFSQIWLRKSPWLPGIHSQFFEEIKQYINLPFKLDVNKVHQKPKGSSTQRKPLKTSYSKPRQKTMYHNCQLVAPDGELLCSCDKSKAKWYIDRGLGKKVNDEPFTVQLNFEPSGRPTLDNIFYTKEKTNQCVVCGKTENFHRKLVIPSEYRKYFPNLMKKNLSHDVLLLCVYCHKKSNILDLEIRLKLAELCDAPLGSQKNVKFQLNPQIVRVKSAATAISSPKNKIPDSRLNELKQIIMDYFNVTAITEDILKEACNLETSSLNNAFIPHGLKVYQYFCKNGGLIELEKIWRQHFLDTMQPQFLPTMWSVEHNHKRLAIQVVNHEREVDFDESILGLSDELVKEIEQFRS